MSMVHTLVVHQNLLGVFQNIDAWVSPLSPHKSEICWGQAQASLFTNPGNSLVVSWLGLYTSTAATAGNMGSVPGRETRILLAAWYSKKERKEKKKITPYASKSTLLQGAELVLGTTHPWSQCCSSGSSPVTLKEMCNLSEWPFPNL